MLQKLHDAPNILRSVGLTVEVLPDFATTARSNDSSSYANGRPTHFIHHHTATSVTAHDNHTGSGSCQSEARSLQLAEPNEPTSNFGVCPHGVWFCICAGPSNTNGVGADTWHPVGDPLRVPDNSMNSYAMANEMMNNGVGEPYPDIMIEAVLKGTAALCLAYSIGVFENRAHFEWAPTRKIDPAGPCKYMRSGDPSKRWDMGLFRTDIQLEMSRQANVPVPGPSPIPPYTIPVGDEVITGLWKGPNDPGVYAVCSNRTKIWCYPGTVDEHQALLRLEGKSDAINVQTSAEMFRAFGPVVGPRPGNVDEYGWV